MSAFLELLKFFGHVGVLVIFVQWITTRGQSISWRRGAITEGSAKALALNLAPLRRVPEQFGIRQYHPAEAHEVDPSFAHNSLRYIR
jgi:hypothetical protein